MATKITKREVITSMLNNVDIASNETYKAYLTHELELLDKKSSSKKPTKVQKENEGIKEKLLEVLAECEEPISVTDLLKKGDLIETLSNQKTTSLLKQLVEDGLVKRTVGKKSQALFEVNDNADSGEI